MDANDVKNAPVRTPGYVKVVSVLFVCIVAFVVVANTPLGPWLSVKNLERQVKSNIDPMELQQWATNLLDHESSHYEDFYGTNLPAGLKKVWGYNHAVRIFDGKNGRDVGIFCGGKSGPWLVVGPPSMPTPTNAYIIAWKPGIYFMGH
jgi:hypothetical protein